MYASVAGLGSDSPHLGFARLFEIFNQNLGVQEKGKNLEKIWAFSDDVAPKNFFIYSGVRFQRFQNFLATFCGFRPFQRSWVHEKAKKLGKNLGGFGGMTADELFWRFHTVSASKYCIARDLTT